MVSFSAIMKYCEYSQTIPFSVNFPRASMAMTAGNLTQYSAIMNQQHSPLRRFRPTFWKSNEGSSRAKVLSEPKRKNKGFSQFQYPRYQQ
jgi:hypothetical protein